MELPTERYAYVTIALLDMPFRTQKYGPWGHPHQAIWQPVMERLDQLQVVGWKVCWARVVDKPTVLAIIIYHPKYPNKHETGPDHDTLFLQNVLAPLVECIRYPPRIINLTFEKAMGMGLVQPENKLVDMYLFDVAAQATPLHSRHETVSSTSTNPQHERHDTLSILPLPILSYIGSTTSSKTDSDFRRPRRGFYLPPSSPDQTSSPSDIRHEALTIELLSHKARSRFQDPTKPSTGVSHSKTIWDNAWATDFVQPLHRLVDEGVIVGIERLVLEMRGWPVGKKRTGERKGVQMPEQLVGELSVGMRELELAKAAAAKKGEERKKEEKEDEKRNELFQKESLKKWWWYQRWSRRGRLGDQEDMEGREEREEERKNSSGERHVDHAEEVVQWAKGHSRTDSGWSEGNYVTRTTSYGLEG